MTARSSLDRRWLYAAVLARSLATGMMGVLLGIYLATLQLSANAIGVVIGLGSRAPRSARCWSRFSRIASAAGARCSC